MFRGYKILVKLLFQEFASNAYENTDNAIFVVKREKCGMIKEENEMTSDYPCHLEFVARKDLKSEVEELKNEKAELIQQILSAKSENQRLFLQSKRYEDDIQKLKDLNSTAAAKLLILQNELEKSKQNNSKCIQRLTKQNNVYAAQIRQLQSATVNTMQNQTAESESNYEVENILRHKTTKGERSYLVRWRGYSSEDDNWVKEENLFCPDILTAYKKRKRLH